MELNHPCYILMTVIWEIVSMNNKKKKNGIKKIHLKESIFKKMTQKISDS